MMKGRPLKMSPIAKRRRSSIRAKSGTERCSSPPISRKRPPFVQARPPIINEGRVVITIWVRPPSRRVRAFSMMVL
jgi:hypothetical protein